jgi:hypothetical protein
VRNTFRLKETIFRPLGVTNFQIFEFSEAYMSLGVKYAPLPPGRQKNATKKGGWSYFKK